MKLFCPKISFTFFLFYFHVSFVLQMNIFEFLYFVLPMKGKIITVRAGSKTPPAPGASGLPQPGGGAEGTHGAVGPLDGTGRCLTCFFFIKLSI